MGSAQGKGAREDQAPQTRSGISSLTPARKNGNIERDEEDPLCTE
jgi:hypothetical protein